MDRRLPFRPGPYAMQQGRRNLYVEQRLYTDLLGGARRRTQRYLNPPCCAAAPTPLTVTATTDGFLFEGATAAYVFEGAATSATVEATCDAPADDGRGYGVQVDIFHDASLIATLEMTGTTASVASTALVESFAAGDELGFQVTDMSAPGDLFALNVIVTLDGTAEEFVTWFNPA